MARRVCVFLMVILLISGCSPVDESYATLGRDSISGVDIFLAMMHGPGRNVIRAPFLSRLVLERGDLLVYFDNGYNGDRYFRRIEAWMQGAELDSEKDTKITVPSRKRTLLYFLRDTDSSLPFWKRLEAQMRGYEAERQFCREQMEIREKKRRRFPPHGSVLFGMREPVYREGKWIARLRKAHRFSGVPVRSFPVRSRPERPISYLKPEPLDYIDLLRTVAGDVLIREILLKNARVLLVYNSEPFLNYALARSQERALASGLISYALRPHRDERREGQEEDLRIYYIENMLLPATHAAREGNILRMFTVFPMNIIVVHILGLLALFVLSRWPHEKPPLETRSPGSRDFLEHIRALGLKISRSRNRDESLESLKKVLRKQTGRGLGKQ